VLNEAVESFQKYAFSKSEREQKLFREAKSWIWDDDTDFVFSFRTICELLGIDPAYLRRGLREMKENVRERA
jgi:hypothetical protein